MHTSTSDNRNIGYRVYEVINNRDYAALEELFDPQVVRHAAGEIGLAKARKAMEKAFESGPKKFVVEDLLAEGDKVALRVSVEGFPPVTGKIGLTIIEIFRIENGRVVEIWGAGMAIPVME